MGGGKKKKPLSAADKRRRKMPEPKKVEKQERTLAFHEINDTLIKRASKVIKDMDVVTPYTLANSLNIKLSLARKVMRVLAEKEDLKIIDKSRSVIIAVPASKTSG